MTDKCRVTDDMILLERFGVKPEGKRLRGNLNPKGKGTRLEYQAWLYIMLKDLLESRSGERFEVRAGLTLGIHRLDLAVFWNGVLVRLIEVRRIKGQRNPYYYAFGVPVDVVVGWVGTRKYLERAGHLFGLRSYLPRLKPWEGDPGSRLGSGQGSSPSPPLDSGAPAPLDPPGQAPGASWDGWGPLPGGLGRDPSS